LEKHCSGDQEFVASACYPNAALRLSGNYIFDALSAHLNGYAGAAALILTIATLRRRSVAHAGIRGHPSATCSSAGTADIETMSAGLDADGDRTSIIVLFNIFMAGLLLSRRSTAPRT